MELDYRCYFKCSNSDLWREAMDTIALETTDGDEFSLMEISRVFSRYYYMSKADEPIGDIFDAVTAVEDECFCFIHDHGKSQDFFVRLTEYILEELIGIAKNEFVLIADITDNSDDSFGDRLMYYCGGERDDLLTGHVEGYEGLEHHDIEISNVWEMLEYETLNDTQQAYIDRIIGDSYPVQLMNPTRIGITSPEKFGSRKSGQAARKPERERPRIGNSEEPEDEDDEAEDDDEDGLALFRRLLGIEDDLSEEEKEALITKNTEALKAAVKDFINSSREVRRLLVINTVGRSVEEAGEEELRYADSMTYEDLREAGYIIYDTDDDPLDKNSDRVHCRLSLDATERAVVLTVYCDYGYWNLDGYHSRPLEIQKRLYQHFQGMEVILPKKLRSLSCSSQAIRENTGAVMEAYNEEWSLLSEDRDKEETEKEFPLAHYADIMRVVVERLVQETDIREYLGGEDAGEMTPEELIGAGLIRLQPKVEVEESGAPDRYLIIEPEHSSDITLQFTLMSKKASDLLPDNADTNRMILKCIKKAMNMIPGVKESGSFSGSDLNHIWTMHRGGL